MAPTATKTQQIFRGLTVTLVLLITGACESLYAPYLKPLEVMGYTEIIFKDTVWDATDQPRHIAGNVFILPEATLTIRAGSTLLLAKDVHIKCQGQIVAEGTATAPIRFAGQNRDPWDRIDCFGGRIEKNGQPPRNRFVHCIIEGGRGITARAADIAIEQSILRNNVSSPIRLEYSSGTITGNRIHHNSTTMDTASGNGGGIMVYTDKTVLIADNQVFANLSAGGRDGGGGIYAYAYDNGDVTVENNRVTDNRSDRHGGGVVAYACRVRGNVVKRNQAETSGGGLYAIRSTIRGNTLADNIARQGGGIYAENATLHQNAVIGNRAEPFQGGGLFFFGQGRVAQNTFAGNGSITSEDGETVVVSGNPDINGNNLVSASGILLRVQTHSLGADLNARQNYWGSGDPQVIAALVYDWLNNAEIGLVDWSAYATEPIQAAPAIPSPYRHSSHNRQRNTAKIGIAGILEGEQTIGRADGRPVLVAGNVLVPESATLTIPAGSTFTFAPGIQMRIRGRLNARGTGDAPIRLTGSPANTWGPILFENKSLLETDSTVPAADPNIPDGGELSHCIIEHGRGIVMEGMGARLTRCVIQKNAASGITVRNAATVITGSRIVDNTSDSNGGGIYAYGSRSVRIAGNVIAGNSAKEDGGGVFAYGYHSNTAIDITTNRIEHNSSKGGGGGIWASRSSLTGNRIQSNHAEGSGGGVYATFALVDGNDILANKADKGGGLFAETNSSITRNRIQRNRSDHSDGGGAYLNFWGMSIKNEVFRFNEVTGNTAVPPAETGGVYLNGAMEFEFNNIHGNQGYELYNGNTSDQGSFTARECYWGTSDSGQIEASVYDQRDDPQLSRVTFVPFATKPNRITAK